MSELNINIHGESQNATKFVAKARNFELIIDEPEDLGGTNEGANPVEFLLSAYAGCLNVVGHIVAKEIGFEIKKININISGNLNPDRLFGKSYVDRAGFKSIKVQLEPESNATPQQLENWLREVENRCPINDNLKNETDITVNCIKVFDTSSSRLN